MDWHAFAGGFIFGMIFLGLIVTLAQWHSGRKEG